MNNMFYKFSLCFSLQLLDWHFTWTVATYWNFNINMKMHNTAIYSIVYYVTELHIQYILQILVILSPCFHNQLKLNSTLMIFFSNHTDYGFCILWFVCQFCNCFVVFLMFSQRLLNYAMTVPDGFTFMYVNISHYRYHARFIWGMCKNIYHIALISLAI